jgi:hypothetical protein
MTEPAPNTSGARRQSSPALDSGTAVAAAIVEPTWIDAA